MRACSLLLLAFLAAAPGVTADARAAALAEVLAEVTANAASPPGAQSSAAEVIATIQVHGNVLTPEADIIKAAGIAVGSPFTAATAGEVEARLSADKRFVRVEVLKRFASIADLSQVAVVILVDEGPVTIVRNNDGTAGPGTAEATAETRRSRGLQLLWFPLLRYDEGYGLSYGLRVARADVLGPKSRLSVPVTWGAERRVALQADRVFDHRVLRRLEGGLSLARRVNPAYRVGDTRRRLSSRVDTQSLKGVRADASVGWEQVRFGGDVDDRLMRASVGATVDTRVDPLLARNAVYVRVARERLWWRDSGRPSTAIDTTTVDLRGYLGLYRQLVLVGRAYRDGADAPLPLYERRLSGGGDVLRGFRVGYASGDVLSAGSVELRTPLGNPLNLARLGVSVFFDAAAVYDVGSRLRDQKFDRGVGAGVWLSAALVRFNVAVARGLGRGTRVSVGTSLQF